MIYRNTLIIGDLHEPFTLDDYIDFNRDLVRKYKINDVKFIGDIVDWSQLELPSRNTEP
ncbi:MAG TPA: hypothetical protein VGQ53_18990 [Chitinophagaceae bacterium]|jgi:hypothetical protein|nr:hypothetical protein [Chitinophagaceae bacterium]